MDPTALWNKDITNSYILRYTRSRDMGLQFPFVVLVFYKYIYHIAMRWNQTIIGSYKVSHTE